MGTCRVTTVDTAQQHTTTLLAAGRPGCRAGLGLTLAALCLTPPHPPPIFSCSNPPVLQHSASFVSAARFTLMLQLAVFLVYRKASAPQRQTARGFAFYFPLIPASKHTPLDLLSCRLETSQANPITLGSLLAVRMISSSGIKKPQPAQFKSKLYTMGMPLTKLNCTIFNGQDGVGG